MPPSKLIVANDVSIVRCIAHQMFNQQLVCFVQFDTKPPDIIMNVMRKFAHFRKKPFEGAKSGWYIPQEQIVAISNELRPIWVELSQQIAAIGLILMNAPDSVKCPSRTKKTAVTADVVKKLRYSSVTKL